MTAFSSGYMLPEYRVAPGMPETTPLCPYLYTRLRRIASDGRVLIANAEEPMQFISTWYRDRWQKSVISWGETYRINCPFCNDTRHRLWIPYRFGQTDGSNRLANSYGICFNEDCLRNPDNREDLTKELLDVTNMAALRGNYDPPRISDGGAMMPVRLIPRDWPGKCQPITELPANHFAVEYFAGQRRFNPHVCWEHDLRFCHSVTDPKNRPAIGRVLVPIRHEGTMYGWQGRAPDNRKVCKYFTCHGMSKRHFLYNYDEARHRNFVVVFEGWTDVLRLAQAYHLGDHRNAGVAILGKCLSEQQRALLVNTWYEKPIVICFDPDAWEQSEHVLRMIANERNPLVRVALPNDWDPADFEPGALWEIIQSQSRAAGITLKL